MLKVAKRLGIRKRDIQVVRSDGLDPQNHIMHIGTAVMLAKLGGKVVITKEQWEVLAKRGGGALIHAHSNGDNITLELAQMPDEALPGETIH